ncbi:Uncharacterized protein TCM_037342 [Theobroma cacao]|uniref:Uncharacterized protein n=1 Tax=Theobroma cacao TaxID=3641 RepID=A0A061GLF6_THECC|nr:Uncharacterized protein TCM_037342 [Theobroma cacao]
MKRGGKPLLYDGSKQIVMEPSVESKEAGIGVVARDNTGCTIDGIGRNICAESGIFVEAEALRQGVLLAKEKGFQLVIHMTPKGAYNGIAKEKQ